MPPQEPPKKEEQGNPQEHLSQIRTFQGDVATALDKQKESVFSIRQKEHLKAASGGTVYSAAPTQGESGKRVALLALGSILLICLGLGGAWLGYREYQKKTAPPVITVPENRFITVQKTLEVDVSGLNREGLIAKVSQADPNLDQNKVEEIVLRKGSGEMAPLVTTQEFLTVLGAQAPLALARAFDPLFMLGAIGQSKFILVKLDSYDLAYAGMLDWERTLPQDVGPLFSTAPLMKSITPTTVFRDVAYKNKDARVLIVPDPAASSTSDTALLYSFYDSGTLIMTDSAGTLQSLLSLLNQKLLSQ